MDISSKHMLDKMEELVSKAKQSNSEAKVQGYVIAIQALCEVMVDEKIEDNRTSKPITFTQPVISTVTNAEPVKMEEANGDSLFDF
ncbi:YwdI family protein [Peribacillus sp. NPDC097295]|uniref:YwdI family protein n=1 Tax=Peribacillus sp. NPDC097295 TaxID=3364402 RepID=UPI00381A7495